MGHLRNNHAQGSKYPNSHCFVSIAKTENFRKKKKTVLTYTRAAVRVALSDTRLPPNIPTYLKIRIADSDIT